MKVEDKGLEILYGQWVVRGEITMGGLKEIPCPCLDLNRMEKDYF
jgi:hypothetical protein